MHSQPQFAHRRDPEIQTICNMSSCNFFFWAQVVSIRTMSIHFLEQTGILHNSNLWYANETSLGSLRSSLLSSVFSSVSCPPACNLERRVGASSLWRKEEGMHRWNFACFSILDPEMGFFVYISCKWCFSFFLFTVNFRRFANEKWSRHEDSQATRADVLL